MDYTLRCDQGHSFTAWFPSSGSFQKQKDLGLVSCPHCGSLHVAKGLQTPQVVGGRDRSRATQQHQSPAAQPGAVPQKPTTPPISAEDRAKAQAMLIAMRQLQTHIEKTFDDVGDRFADEARKIHDGESPERGIYGQASQDDVEALLDDGIEVLPLPKLPKLDG